MINSYLCAIRVITLKHNNEELRNTERLLSRYPIFKQFDQPTYSKRVIFSCKSYIKN